MKKNKKYIYIFKKKVLSKSKYNKTFTESDQNFTPEIAAAMISVYWAENIFLALFVFITINPFMLKSSAKNVWTYDTFYNMILIL